MKFLLFLFSGAMITIISSPGAELFEDPGIGQEMCGKTMLKSALPPPTSFRAITPYQPVAYLDANLPSLGIKKYGHTGSRDFLDTSVLMTEANRRQDDYIASSLPPSHSSELTVEARAVSNKSFLVEDMSRLDNNNKIKFLRGLNETLTGYMFGCKMDSVKYSTAALMSMSLIINAKSFNIPG